MNIYQKPPAQKSSDWGEFLKKLHNEPENAKRKRESFVAHMVYSKKQSGFVNDMVEKRFGSETAEKRSVVTTPYMRQLVDSVASIYHQEVKRTINRAKKLDKYLTEKVWDPIDEISDQLAKSIFYQGTMITQSAYSHSTGNIEDIMYFPYSFDLIYVGDVLNKKLYAVNISDYNHDNIKRTDQPLRQWLYIENSTMYFEDYQYVSTTNHNMGFLPFTVVHREHVGSNIYAPIDCGLSNIDLVLNYLYSNLVEISASQTHSTPVLTQPEEYMDSAGESTNNPTLYNSRGQQHSMLKKLPVDDANKVMMLPIAEGMQSPKFEYVTPNANMLGGIETIKALEKSMAVSYGLDADFFELSSVPKPATASILASEKLRGLIKNMETRMRNWEKGILKIAVELLKQDDAQAPGDLDKAKDNLIIEYIFNKINILTPQEAFEAKREGIYDSADVWMAIKPSLSRQEALDMVTERKSTIESESVDDATSEKKTKEISDFERISNA